MKMTKKKMAIAAILLGILVCVSLGDKQRLSYLYDSYILPIIESVMDSDKNQVDEFIDTEKSD